MLMMKLETEKLKRRELIGSGSHGAVYRGYYGQEEQEVAIKVFNSGDEYEEEEEFRQEVYMWSQLNHANVAKFIGATQINTGERENPHWCIVSEFLKGGTLIQYLEKNRKKGTRIPLKKVVQFALDAAKGLAYLHEEDIVHRDVKTNNMVLDGQGTIKLIDFGLSRKEGSDMTRNMGTPKYMAPEVRKCSRYNRKCDVFSFGICLWEMFYCRRVKIMPLGTRPRIHGDCPKKLADLMRKCWLDEERRPDMAEVVEILEEMEMEASSMELEVANYRDRKKKNSKGCFALFR